MPDRANDGYRQKIQGFLKYSDGLKRRATRICAKNALIGESGGGGEGYGHGNPFIGPDIDNRSPIPEVEISGA